MEEGEGEEVPTPVDNMSDTLHHRWRVDNSIGAADEPTWELYHDGGYPRVQYQLDPTVDDLIRWRWTNRVTATAVSDLLSILNKPTFSTHHVPTSLGRLNQIGEQRYPPFTQYSFTDINTGMYSVPSVSY